MHAIASRDIAIEEDECRAQSAGRSAAQVRNRRLPPVYLIIDEYDNFTNQLITTHQDALYREITTGDSFLRTFFKVIKAGVEDRSIGRTFITGVLPITIDDLTSGFNIAADHHAGAEYADHAGIHAGGSRALSRAHLRRL